MAILIKSKVEIEKMRVACSIVRDVLNMLEDMIKPGISTGELNTAAERFIHNKGATPSFKGFNDFPKCLCTSVNEEVIHGIPGLRRLNSGDIISIDVGAYIGGYHGDAARTFGVGKISKQAQALIDCTRDCFFAGIEHARAGSRLNSIGAAIEDFCIGRGMTVVREFVGHGIGKDIHEDPQIVNYREKKRGPKLAAGMILAIEPMVVTGDCEVEILADDWTVVTKDRSLAAHYENTVLITADGVCEILTI
ncbi:MAG: type I methionyl aminopeptidase [Defluviitaleaceae bacterium]|nr:type I methionyl aminopeptidase [Defluviitaleaceae bacterium]